MALPKKQANCLWEVNGLDQAVEHKGEIPIKVTQCTQQVAVYQFGAAIVCMCLNCPLWLLTWVPTVNLGEDLRL